MPWWAWTILTLMTLLLGAFIGAGIIIMYLIEKIKD